MHPRLKSKRDAVLTAVLASTFFVSVCAAQDSLSLSWGDIERGPHEAGFRVVCEYDQSRTKRSAYDYKNHLRPENNARPIQIAVWYPCHPVSGAERMLYAEYEFTRGTRFDYTRERGEILDQYPDRFGSPGTDRALVIELRNRILNRETTVFKDAPPAEGQFPLVLFCSGGGDAPDSHDVLFEYLASHGYVVAAISSQGMFKNAPSYNLMDEESQVRDLEFVMAYMRSSLEVDTRRVCAMGYSYGGLVNVLFALRNFDVNAVLSLDGSICLKDRDRAVKTLPYFDPARLTSAFMNMAREPHADQDFGFFNELIYSDAYLLHFDTLRHADFTSRPFVADYSDPDAPENRNVTRVDIHQGPICWFVLQFLNAYLMDDAEAAAFLGNSPEENGIDSGFVRIEYKQALPSPPKDEDFFQLIDDEGVTVALGAYRQARQTEPGVILFDETEMNRQAYIYLGEGKFEEAIMLFELVVDSYPDSWNAYDSLAEGYWKNGQVDLAVEFYEQSLAINPENGNASEILKRLESERP